MAIRYLEELRTVEGVSEPPYDYVEGAWEAWHDEYVRALSKIDGVEYLTLDAEVHSRAVLIDRRGVLYTKSWDGQEIYDRDYPEAWTWNALAMRLEGWDPNNALMLGPELGIQEWHELSNESTMPLRIIPDAALETYDFTMKCLAQDESCGPGGVRRGRTVIADSVPEAVAFIKRHWKGKTD